MLLDTEFEYVDGGPACENCAPGLKAEVRKRQAEGLKLPGGWWTRAILFGAGAAITGSIIYAMIILATGFEATFLVLAIGAAVGIAARAGAGNKGGVPLQLIAVGLVYLSLFIAYAVVAAFALGAGDLGGLTAQMQEFRSEFGDGPGALAFAVSRPFLSGPVGLISLVLGFFAAWRFCSEGEAGRAGQGIWQKLADSSKD
ncbi:MAG: hypothetical protein ABI972_10445 [Acidobacteriota bacterium]